MATQRILQDALTDEARRTVLREATHRYNHELLDDEERQLLLDRIKRLRRFEEPYGGRGPSGSGPFGAALKFFRARVDNEGGRAA